MKPRQVDDAIRATNPVPAGDPRVEVGPAGRELHAAITAEPFPVTVTGVRRDAARPRRLAAVATAAVVVLAAAFVLSARNAPEVAAATIEFSRDPSAGTITAVVTDLAADPAAYRTAFREQQLDISLTLVPASPSMVGQIVALGGDADGITPLEGAGCPTENRCGPVGIVVPSDFNGSAQVTLGRAARSGELYVTAGDAFAPGEALHCLQTEVLGAPVRTVASILGEHDLEPVWRDAQGRAVASPPDRSFASAFTPLAAGKVVVFTSPERPQIDAARSSPPTGCP